MLKILSGDMQQIWTIHYHVANGQNLENIQIRTVIYLLHFSPKSFAIL